MRSAKGDPSKQQRSSSDLFGIPVRSKKGDAGFDLVVAQHVIVFSGQCARVSHNLAVALPEGTYGLIVPRSSTLHEKGLIVLPGVIDAGFRGEVQTVVQNVSPHSAQVIAGERISQLLILPLLDVRVVEEEKLDETERGESGFGSTGGFVKKGGA